MLDRIDVVLVEPQSPGNIGSAARALHNMGLSSLVLVRPPAFDVPEARRMAMGGLEILLDARRAGSLAGAIEDAGLVIGTTRRAGKNRGPLLDVREAMARAAAASREGNRVALVFGREDAGLTTAELDACHLLARIPTGPENPSLNLAAAVLVTTYELRREAVGSDAGDPRELATSAEQEAMLADLGELLGEVGFLNPQNPEEIMHALRRFLGRAELEPRDVRILRGITRQLRWGVRHKPRA